MKEIVLFLSKTSGEWAVKQDNLDEFDLAGVWVMQGRASNLGKWKRLEVGETSNIRDELRRDCNEILSPSVGKDTGEIKFPCFRTWSECITGNKGETRFQAKYRQISENYNEIRVFVVLKDESRLERCKKEVLEAMTWDKDEDENIGAVYWYPAPPKNGINQWNEVAKIEKRFSNN